MVFLYNFICQKSLFSISVTKQHFSIPSGNFYVIVWTLFVFTNRDPWYIDLGVWSLFHCKECSDLPSPPAPKKMKKRKECSDHYFIQNKSQKLILVMDRHLAFALETGNLMLFQAFELFRCLSKSFPSITSWLWRWLSLSDILELIWSY